MAELKYGRWPDVNAMKYFKKPTSANFKQKMGELVLSEETAQHFWYQFSLGKVRDDMLQYFFFFEFFDVSPYRNKFRFLRLASYVISLS